MHAGGLDVTIVPQWTERITSKDVVGEDHLGIETAAINYQGELLPGIITVTEHARYYSFYCWILWRFINDEKHDRKLSNFRGAFFKRLELAHTLACFVHHEDGPALTGIIGSRKAGNIWDEDDPINLDKHTDRYFKNKLGGFGQYYLTPMRVMGLIGDPPNSSDVYQLTQRGKDLAEAFDHAIQDTRYYKALQTKDVHHITHDDAREYGQRACLCSEALAKGEDRDLLREALFRLEDGTRAAWHHRERRKSLALLLDMVRKSGNHAFRDTMRNVLYLGDYAAGHPYDPVPALRNTYRQWCHVQTRQLYTNALQVMWHVFLKCLREIDRIELYGMSLDEFLNWLEIHDTKDVMNIPLLEFIHQPFEQLGIPVDWQSHTIEYSEASKFNLDALTVFDTALSSKNFTVNSAMRMLRDLFLRFFHLHDSQDSLWEDLAIARQESHRLPMQVFFNGFHRHLSAKVTFRDVVRWLYQEYILSQHEYMAIRKLRYNGYDTFKFQYVEGRFYPTAKVYEQPIRHPSLRLSNGLTMLIDVGLIETAGDVYRLSDDGIAYLQQTERLSSEH